MNKNTTDKQIWWRSVVRVYVSGLIVLVIAIIMWKFVFRASPLFDLIDSPLLASILTAIGLVVLPLIFGGIVRYGLNPVLGKWRKWSDLMNLEDRILGELASSSQPQIVLFNWPFESVKSIGVVTSRYPATETQPEMAAVFCPSSPRGNAGFIRFVAVADLHFTDWTLSEFQLFNLTLGSVHPDQLLRDAAN